MSNKFHDLKQQLQNLRHSQLKKNPNISGIGIACFSLADFKTISSDEFFTPAEISYSKNRISSLAGRYGAKIAARQALAKDIPFTNMWILPSRSSQPVFHSPVFTNLKAPDNFSVSISHEEDLIVALAVYSQKDYKICAGVDASTISRFDKILKNHAVLKRIFTPREIQEIKESKDAALLWAGKEAVSKALGIGIWHGGTLLEIEISEIYKKPVVKLKKSLLQRLKELNLTHCNLSFISDNNHAVAFAIF